MTQLPLALSSPVRRSDPASSHEAASRITETGQRATEAAACLGLVRRYPGSTSAELAALHAGDDREARARWRYILARRLTELEDAGQVEAVGPAPYRRRPWRRVDPNLEPCRESGIRAMRWWGR